MIFEDRESAGRKLAEVLREKIRLENKPLILAIPRGGIPVAYALAKELRVPMSVVVVRKLGLPWNEEAGFGAVDPDGHTYLDEETVRYAGLDRETIRRIAEKELEELRKREEKFLPRGYPDVRGREVVVVDDGVATGYTAIAAAGFARKRGAKKVLVAVPVCPADASGRFGDSADEFVCFYPSDKPGFAVGMFYRDFHQLSDEETLSYLKRAEQEGLLEPGG
ncbi:MAG TPA: phosphoribosyltransferase [Aquifex aeolicus]|uniref:Phosphoribosyltransferase n=1 Tax=Aquifex aeolicus TaxID=63363 RepID=A0A7C5QL96_AQUAO|nr:phosphoribosyltransferase [Aquifex aeolicus]